MSRQPFARRAIMALVGIAALALVACGGDDSDDENVDAPDDSATGSIAMDADTVQHHWFALVALRSGEVDDAAHHVDHIIGVVGGAHLVEMEEVAAQLAAGDLHEAEHGIEGMLAGQAEFELTSEVLHLQLALDAMSVDDSRDAMHHVGHFVATAHEEDAEEGEAVLRALDAGDAHEAEEQLAELITRLADEADSHDADHEHDEADEGDVRTIEVVMTEFAFEPNEIHVQVGETVRLLLRNEGGVLHDITTEEFHGDVEAANSATHDDGNGDHHADVSEFHAAAEAGGTSELVFTAEEAGTFDLFCSVPGHQQLGMTATLIVEES